MQKGASLSASQLLKVITRGRTSRLSAEPLLDFFRPLEAWLELQNRDETVSNMLNTRGILTCNFGKPGNYFLGNRMVVKHG